MELTLPSEWCIDGAMLVFLAFGLVEWLLLLPGGMVLMDVAGAAGKWRGLMDTAMFWRLLETWWPYLLFASVVMAGWCRVVQSWCAARNRQGYALPLILILLPSTIVWWSPEWLERMLLWLAHAGWMLLQQRVYVRLGDGRTESIRY